MALTVFELALTVSELALTVCELALTLCELALTVSRKIQPLFSRYLNYAPETMNCS